MIAFRIYLLGKRKSDCGLKMFNFYSISPGQTHAFVLFIFSPGFVHKKGNFVPGKPHSNFGHYKGRIKVCFEIAEPLLMGIYCIVNNRASRKM